MTDQDADDLPTGSVPEPPTRRVSLTPVTAFDEYDDDLDLDDLDIAGGAAETSASGPVRALRPAAVGEEPAE